MFINLSNHPSSAWDEKQLTEAKKYGTIKDIPFPNIPAEMTSLSVKELSEQYAQKIISAQPQCVMIQGEFTFTYNIITTLKNKNIKVVAACSERLVKQEGKKKISIFNFVQFREY